MKFFFALILTVLASFPASAQTSNPNDPFAGQPSITQQDIDNFLKIYEKTVVAIQNKGNPVGSFGMVNWDMIRGTYIMSKVSVGMMLLGPELEETKKSKSATVPKYFVPSDAELELIKKNKPKFDALDAKHGWDPFSMP